MIEKEKESTGQVPAKKMLFTLEEYGKGAHCCSNMNLHIHEKERIILYRDQTREYAIRACGHIIQPLTFCPWCGIKLPHSLRDAFFETLQKEYGLDVSILEIDDSDARIPAEFKTDKWWKKRGL